MRRLKEFMKRINPWHRVRIPGHDEAIEAFDASFSARFFK